MGGGGAFVAPAPVVSEFVAPPNGAWSHIQQPRAMYLSGKTVFGYVGGVTGNVELRSYDHATTTVSAAKVLHAALGGAEGNPDHHDNPSIAVLPNGKWLTTYSGHDAAALYVSISPNAAPDITGSWTETNIDASVGGADYTYPCLVILGSDIYLFYRDESGGIGRLAYTVSSDNGATWSARTVLYSPGAARTAYWQVVGNGVDRLDIVVTDGSPPAEAAPVKVYHMYIQSGTRRKSDGTAIAAALPLGPSDLTTVYSSAPDRAWPWDAILRGDGTPQFVLQIVGAADNTIRDYRWTGSAWQGTDITTTGGVFTANISPGAGIDQADPNVVYILKKVSGVWEMYRYATATDGLTWTNTAVTFASASDNLSPSTVRGHNGELPIVWFYGPYTNYLVFATGIKGLVLP